MGCTVVEIPYALSAYAALADADIVHDHTVAGPLCVRRRRGAPVVTTNHGPFNADLNPIYAEMSRQGIAVVAISHHQDPLPRMSRSPPSFTTALTSTTFRLVTGTAGTRAPLAG